jgi:glucose/arabinose dehydrogenase
MQGSRQRSDVTSTGFKLRASSQRLARQAGTGVIQYYTGGQFPAEYRGDAFAMMRVSWNRAPASGYKVARLRFQNGQPTAIDDFITGFLSNEDRANFGRLVGLAQLPDGSLLVGNDTNGVIYRVSHGGNEPSMFW